MSPLHVDVHFFWDKLIDDVAGETIIAGKDGKQKSTTKLAYEGPRQVNREYVASITMSIQAFKNLADAINRIAKDLDTDKE